MKNFWLIFAIYISSWVVQVTPSLAGLFLGIPHCSLRGPGLVNLTIAHLLYRARTRNTETKKSNNIVSFKGQMICNCDRTGRSRETIIQN